MAHENRGIIGNIASRPIAFAATFAVCFFMIYTLLALTDMLPETPSSSLPVVRNNTSTEVVAETKLENPTKVVIEKLGMNVNIQNPTSTHIDALEHALSSGAVRYPTSAKLGQKGTVLLLGHSSNLPVIHNPAYKAFKGIEKLKEGDVVSVYSDTLEYRYSVTKVYVANANEDVIELRQDGTYLVLVTCDTLTSKSARFVVEAKFVGTYSLAN